jgi:hypothetical protein
LHSLIRGRHHIEFFFAFFYIFEKSSKM